MGTPTKQPKFIKIGPRDKYMVLVILNHALDNSNGNSEVENVRKEIEAFKERVIKIYPHQF